MWVLKQRKGRNEMKTAQITILKDTYLIEIFSTVSRKFIILAEHNTLKKAKADLAMWRAS